MQNEPLLIFGSVKFAEIFWLKSKEMDFAASTINSFIQNHNFHQSNQSVSQPLLIVFHVIQIVAQFDEMECNGIKHYIVINTLLISEFSQ